MRMFRSFSTTAVALSLMGCFFATAPNATAAVPAAASSDAARGVTVVSGNTGLQRQTFAQFQAKAAAAGISIDTTSTAATADRAAASGCWYYTDWRKQKNIFGSTLWTFNVQPNWCGNGSWISSAYNNTWADVSFPGWSYKGLTQSTNRYGAGWNVYENIRQGHFCLASYFDCVQNTYPYVDVEVGAGGQVYKN